MGDDFRDTLKRKTSNGHTPYSSYEAILRAVFKIRYKISPASIEHQRITEWHSYTKYPNHVHRNARVMLPLIL